MLKKPKRTKRTKAQKGRISYSYRKGKGEERSYSIVALEPGKITASQIYATELAMKRKIRMGGIKSKRTFTTRIFPHIPVTKKPIEVRMGKGKGKVDHWMTRVKTGTVLYTIKIENKMLIETVWKLVESKLPIKTGLKKGKELEKA